MKKNIGIIGAGSFGIALAYLLENNGHSVKIWTRSPENAKRFDEERGNTSKLPGVTLKNAAFTPDMEEALKDADEAVLVVPSIHIRETAALMRPYLKKGALIVDCAKGIEESTLNTLSEVITGELGELDPRIVVLSGPSHAEEVSKGLPTVIVAASDDAGAALEVQDDFMCPVFRVYTSDDRLGVELGGAVKNVIALAAGVADGLGYGDNTKAAMITRGMSEMARLGTAIGAKQTTFFGLAGVGDLIVTCASMHSRNRRAGILIGQGISAKEACDRIGMVVEGVHCTRAAHKLAGKYGVTTPIIDEVYRVLFEDKAPADAVADLMLRDKKAE
ncbi:MAG: NAD(P)-dependent glycerol-3-phosphate dehydrogenase [Lachnospiraceae bacterium]|nr:NAD(P)-dependent glycerol-3-phosphate dehydrogenase [Lachnospiraceae bacterium]